MVYKRGSLCQHSMKAVPFLWIGRKALNRLVSLSRSQPGVTFGEHRVRLCLPVWLLSFFPVMLLATVCALTDGISLAAFCTDATPFCRVHVLLTVHGWISARSMPTATTRTERSAANRGEKQSLSASRSPQTVRQSVAAHAESIPPEKEDYFQRRDRLKREKEQRMLAEQKQAQLSTQLQATGPSQ